MGKYRVILFALLTLLIVAAIPAVAQQPATTTEQQQETAKAEDPAAPQTASEEIVVTARKREENVQEVPIAVTVVTADKLEEAAAADLSRAPDAGPEPLGLPGTQPVDDPHRVPARHRPGRSALGRRSRASASTSTTSTSPARRARCSTSTTSSASRCCADRRARSTARTPSAARSSTSAARSPTSRTGAGLAHRRRVLDARRPGQHRRRAHPGQAPRQARVRLAEPRRLRREPLHRPRRVRPQDLRRPRRARLAGHGRREGRASPPTTRKDDAEPKGYQRLAPNRLCPLVRHHLPAERQPLGHAERTRAAQRHRVEGRLARHLVRRSTTPGTSSRSPPTASPTPRTTSTSTPRRRASSTSSATYYDEQLTQELQFVYDAGGKLDRRPRRVLLRRRGRRPGQEHLRRTRSSARPNGKTFTDSIARLRRRQLRVSTTS